MSSYGFFKKASLNAATLGLVVLLATSLTESVASVPLSRRDIACSGPSCKDSVPVSAPIIPACVGPKCAPTFAPMTPICVGPKCAPTACTGPDCVVNAMGNTPIQSSLIPKPAAHDDIEKVCVGKDCQRDCVGDQFKCKCTGPDCTYVLSDKLAPHAIVNPSKVILKAPVIALTDLPISCTGRDCPAVCSADGCKCTGPECTFTHADVTAKPSIHNEQLQNEIAPSSSPYIPEHPKASVSPHAPETAAHVNDKNTPMQSEHSPINPAHAALVQPIPKTALTPISKESPFNPSAAANAPNTPALNPYAPHAPTTPFSSAPAPVVNPHLSEPAPITNPYAPHAPEFNPYAVPPSANPNGASPSFNPYAAPPPFNPAYAPQRMGPYPPTHPFKEMVPSTFPVSGPRASQPKMSPSANAKPSYPPYTNHQGRVPQRGQQPSHEDYEDELIQELEDDIFAELEMEDKMNAQRYQPPPPPKPKRKCISKSQRKKSESSKQVSAITKPIAPSSKAPVTISKQPEMAPVPAPKLPNANSPIIQNVSKDSAYYAPKPAMNPVAPPSKVSAYYTTQNGLLPKLDKRSNADTKVIVCVDETCGRSDKSVAPEMVVPVSKKHVDAPVRHHKYIIEEEVSLAVEDVPVEAPYVHRVSKLPPHHAPIQEAPMEEAPYIPSIVLEYQAPLKAPIQTPYHPSPAQQRQPVAYQPQAPTYYAPQQPEYIPQQYLAQPQYTSEQQYYTCQDDGTCYMVDDNSYYYLPQPVSQQYANPAAQYASPAAQYVSPAAQYGSPAVQYGSPVQAPAAPQLAAVDPNIAATLAHKYFS